MNEKLKSFETESFNAYQLSSWLVFKGKNVKML